MLAAVASWRAQCESPSGNSTRETSAPKFFSYPRVRVMLVLSFLPHRQRTAPCFASSQLASLSSSTSLWPPRGPASHEPPSLQPPLPLIKFQCLVPVTIHRWYPSEVTPRSTTLEPASVSRKKPCKPSPNRPPQRPSRDSPARSHAPLQCSKERSSF